MPETQKYSFFEKKKNRSPKRSHNFSLAIFRFRNLNFPCRDIIKLMKKCFSLPKKEKKRKLVACLEI